MKTSGRLLGTSHPKFDWKAYWLPSLCNCVGLNDSVLRPGKIYKLTKGWTLKLKRLRYIMVALAVAFTSVIQTENAGASVSQQDNWFQGRLLNDTAGLWTSGTWFFSRSTLKYFLLVPDHTLRYCRGCGFRDPWNPKRYENSANNWFDINSVYPPSNPSYAYYDMALIDFGYSKTAAFNGVWNYCTALNCTSYHGGGTQRNANWAGWHYHLTGVNNAQPGWGVIASKVRSGTSWGGVVGAHHMVYDGYDYWGIRVDGVSGCGVADGDSGAPVSTGNYNEVYLGMLTATLGGWTVPGPSPCYDSTEFVSDKLVYIPYSTVLAAWPNLSLTLATNNT